MVKTKLVLVKTETVMVSFETKSRLPFRKETDPLMRAHPRAQIFVLIRFYF